RSARTADPYRRKQSRDELVQKGVPFHEHGEVAALRYRDERLARRADGLNEVSGETRWRGEILGTLEDEDRHRKVAAECLRGQSARCARLRNQALGAQYLPVEPVVDIVRSVVGSIKCEADHGRDKEIGALEQIRPSALYGVSTAIGVRRRSNVFELADGARLAESHRLLEQRVVGHTIVSLRVRHLTGADERGKKVGPRLRHEDTENRT